MIAAAMLQTAAPFLHVLAYGGGAGVAVGLLGLLILALTAPKEKPQAAHQTSLSGDNYNVGGPNYGHVGPVNVAPRRFALLDDDIANIVNGVPKGRRIMLRVIGGQRAQEMGERLAQAFRSAGIPIDIMRIGAMAPPPDDPLSVVDRGSTYEITLAPGVN